MITQEAFILTDEILLSPYKSFPLYTQHPTSLHTHILCNHLIRLLNKIEANNNKKI